MQPTQIQSNPQGKGVVPVLSLWHTFSPATIERKATEQLFAEYFSSLLVLSAEFRFKPVKETVYFLYLKKQRWMLSLIEPGRWSYEQRGEYFGSCQLQQDMTWSINRADPQSSHPDINRALEVFYQQLVLHLDSERPLIDLLPFYVDDLPYYRRMAATGLARSMRHSFAASTLLEQPSKNWLLSLQSANDNTGLPRLG